VSWQGPPTLAGFNSFVTNGMGVPKTALQVGSPYPGWAFDWARATVNPAIGYASCTPLYYGFPGYVGAPPGGFLYTMAVYNLGGDFLINIAQDQVVAPAPADCDCDDPPPLVSTTPLNYWTNLRGQFKIVPFVSGVISSTADEGTSESLQVIEVAKNFLLSDLQNLKTPYGRTYLGIAMKFGTLWGLS
jgi:hypothetical protein